MNDKIIYSENIRSNKTQALFILLTILFLSLLFWHVFTKEYNAWRILFFSLFAVFLFYVINYRTLIIRLTPMALTLTFGVFSWKIPIENIEECQLDDDLPPLLKYGGAGIHFFLAHKRYRASFNFLEYQRIVITLKEKKGPVRDISFTTRQPEKLLSLIENAGDTHG
ncbi:MAG TPA: hypothetical protein VLA72_05435 [Anaerolineales bacterium]|nr:hypothetical protein [Anaerolineales bacterium]